MKSRYFVEWLHVLLFYRSDVLCILHCLVQVGFVHPILSLPDILYFLCYLPRVITSVCYFLTMQIVAIKGGGRPTRLLPHAKMLLILIKLFLSAG